MTSAHNSPTAHASVPIPPPIAANANAQLYKCYKDGRPPPSFDQVIDVDREHAEVEELPLHEDTPEWLRSGTRPVSYTHLTLPTKA